MALITCKECGAEISDKAVTCPKCGAPLQEIPGVMEEEKEDSIEQWLDLRWLCFILPPLGPILYLIQKDDSPERAKKYLIAAGIGLVFDIVAFAWWGIF